MASTTPETSYKQTHIAIIPNPGAGHLIPLAEFCRHLLLHNPSLFFTFILTPSSATSSSTTTTPPTLSSLPATAFDVINLPPPSFPAFSDLNDEICTRVLQSINRSLPHLRKTLQDMITCDRLVTALIVDIFATDIIDVGSELGIKSYIFCSSSAIALSMFLHLPKQIDDTNDDEWGPHITLEFPGCPIIQVKDLPDAIHHPSNKDFKWFVDHCRRFQSAEAIVLNSFQGLEEGPIRSMKTIEQPVYVVGPLVKTGLETDPSGCLRWLDQQPPGSVLYVNFGSGGTLSTNQVTELARGLEMSEQRFMWVVRSPNDSVSFGTFLSLEEERDPLGFLPEGFLDRTKGRGLVVQSWAPQAGILGHGSTGGFLTHCGWNSVLEGAVNGVGFIAWPLYSEQKMNAVELVDEVKVALRVLKNKDGVVGRDEIARVVKALMEGEEGMEIKERMKTLKDEARRAMDRDGASTVSLSTLAYKW